MHASLAQIAEPRAKSAKSRPMSFEKESQSKVSQSKESQPRESQPDPVSPTDSSTDVETKRAIRELLDVLPQDVLDELNHGVIDLKDPAFFDGLMDHVARLSLASPRTGQRILGKIIKLKKLISRSLRDSDPEVAVSVTVTRTGQRTGRNDACPCGSGKKYKQCCLRKHPH